ncbi:hypothetical protein AJ79_01122 [Helicocarpus griseus UAMH5409]|uniref:PAP-associated domain-containing protein n=1 Tax=Helicocarpus griseus UAMH5409 TaxID=1447875 RepID=A0A2B7Y9I4_9EURO|nr:hypothetical protein AJ79_01122 [Helicocarpus griseus UAMH5409]
MAIMSAHNSTRLITQHNLKEPSHDYLTFLASRIPRWGIPRKELIRREIFRRKLVKLTKDAIYRLLKDNGVPPRDNDLQVDLRCYGSFRSGFAMPTSDLDLQFISNNIPYRLQSSIPFALRQAYINRGIYCEEVLEKCAKLIVCDANHDKNESLSTNAVAPKLYTSYSDHRQSCTANHCIIRFPSRNADLSMHSTELLRCYRACDDRVYDMGIFIKRWAAARQINNPSANTLSSYGYILMILHYLLNVTDPPVIPNLQHCNIGFRELEWVEGEEVFYWRNIAEIVKAADQRKLTRNRQSVPSLLRGFFDYYSGGGYVPGRRRFCYKDDVVSIRSCAGRVTKRERGIWASNGNGVDNTNLPKKRQRCFLVIEDPFRACLNIATTVDWEGVWVIRNEFARARDIIEAIDCGEIGEDFFAPRNLTSDTLMSHSVAVPKKRSPKPANPY